MVRGWQRRDESALDDLKLDDQVKKGGGGGGRRTFLPGNRGVISAIRLALAGLNKAPVWDLFFVCLCFTMDLVWTLAAVPMNFLPCTETNT
jgi:hypothetical protein